MMENKMLVIENVSKDRNIRILKMNVKNIVKRGTKNNADLKRRLQFETTKILYFKYETYQ